ncbi:MAG TPA: helix-hairpin-helix domain-containing protein [Kofleriaceae bacterium]|nr:helix-hairpin-helix domain-containing protein [Kofleriaceae bacterium]
MSISISKLASRFAPVAALVALVVAMDGTWATAQPTTTPLPARPVPGRGAAGGPTPSPAPSLPASAPQPSRLTAAADPAGDPPTPRPARKEVSGKLNLNTATEEQLMLLPTVGPSKAERIVVWRKKNGGFRRVADLRRVKGFGYKTLKRLEPFLDIQGETTLGAKR